MNCALFVYRTSCMGFPDLLRLTPYSFNRTWETHRCRVASHNLPSLMIYSRMCLFWKETIKRVDDTKTACTVVNVVAGIDRLANPRLKQVCKRSPFGRCAQNSLSANVICVYRLPLSASAIYFLSDPAERRTYYSRAYGWSCKHKRRYGFKASFVDVFCSSCTFVALRCTGKTVSLSRLIRKL